MMDDPHAYGGPYAGRRQIDMVHLIIGSLVVGSSFRVFTVSTASNYGASSGFLYGVLIGLLIGFGRGLDELCRYEHDGHYRSLHQCRNLHGILWHRGLVGGLIYQKTAPRSRNSSSTATRIALVCLENLVITRGFCCYPFEKY